MGANDQIDDLSAPVVDGSRRARRSGPMYSARWTRRQLIDAAGGQDDAVDQSRGASSVSGTRRKAWLTLRRATVAALIVTVALGVLSDLLFVAALQFRPDWFANPALLVSGGSASAELLRWAALADLFSYYLPTAVVALALWQALRYRRPIVALVASMGALGYVGAGSIGAASLAMVGPTLIRGYAQPGADQAAIATAFGLLADVVFRAVWQLVDGVFIAVWMIGIGLLMRTDQPAFARLARSLGVLFLIGAMFNALGLGLARDATLGVVFVAWTVWDVWLATLVWRRRSPFGELAQSSGGADGKAAAH
jgi:hypothetical protein